MVVDEEEMMFSRYILPEEFEKSWLSKNRVSEGFYSDVAIEDPDIFQEFLLENFGMPAYIFKDRKAYLIGVVDRGVFDQILGVTRILPLYQIFELFTTQRGKRISKTIGII